MVWLREVHLPRPQPNCCCGRGPPLPRSIAGPGAAAGYIFNSNGLVDGGLPFPALSPIAAAVGGGRPPPFQTKGCCGGSAPPWANRSAAAAAGGG